MRVHKFPDNKRGVTWFWGLLRPGENGTELASRCPPLPDDIQDDDIEIWTKINCRHPGVAILARSIRGKLKVYSALVP